jgi:hypothetical protein
MVDEQQVESSGERLLSGGTPSFGAFGHMSSPERTQQGKKPFERVDYTVDRLALKSLAWLSTRS